MAGAGADSTVLLETAPKSRVAEAALGTFFNIVEAWHLDTAEAVTLLGCTRRTFFNWKRKPANANLSRDTLERISYVLGIFKALQILLPAPDIADRWLTTPNQAQLFSGSRPVDRLLQGNVADLYEVRRYLDGQRGW